MEQLSRTLSFPVLKAFGKNPQRQYFGPGQGFICRFAVSQHAWQFSYFGQPAPIVFAFAFEGQLHARLLEICRSLALAQR